MHAYATNAKERENIPRYIAVVAVIAAVLLTPIFQVLSWPIIWYIGTPAVASFYALFLWLFDSFLWSKKIGPLPLSHIPDIRGTWVGTLHSSFHNTEVQVVMYIYQTWSKLSIKLKTASSKSSTTMAVLTIDAGNESDLKYAYRNEGNAFGTTPDHSGTAHVNLSPNGKTLEGKYYTSEGSNNTGTITLKLLSREYLSHEDSLEQAKRNHFI